MGSGTGTASGTSTVLGVSPGEATHDASFVPGMGIYSIDSEEQVGRTVDATLVSGMGLFSGVLCDSYMPVHEKTYEFAVNRALDTGGTSLSLHQDAMLYMKNTMKSWTTPWTVTQSCRYVGPGGGGSISDFEWGAGDLWGNISHLFWGNPYFSWIVLQAPVGSMQILIVLNYTPNQCVMHISPEGLFTEGTGPGVAGWPTAVDALNVYGYGFGAQPTHDWLHNRNSVFPGQIHMLQSTDGEMSMFVCCANNMACGHWIFWKSQEPVAGWDAPYSFFTSDFDDPNEGLSYTTGLTYPLGLYSWAHAKRAYVGGQGNAFRHTMTTEGGNYTSGSNLYPIGRSWGGANAISGTYPMSPMFAASYGLCEASGASSPSIGMRGFLGRIPDLYCTATGLSTGDTIEKNALSPEQIWAVMGDAVIPWNGSTPLIS